MGVTCCAYNCTNRRSNTNRISFFTLPLKKKSLLKKWLFVIRREKWNPTKHSRICSEHFTPESFRPTTGKLKLLRDNAVPSLFNFPKPAQKRIKRKSLVELYSRAQTKIETEVKENHAIEDEKKEHVENKNDDICVSEVKMEYHDNFEEVEVKSDPDEVFKVEPEFRNEPEVAVHSRLDVHHSNSDKQDKAHYFVICKSRSESYLVSTEFLNTLKQFHPVLNTRAMISEQYGNIFAMLSDDVTGSPDTWNREDAIPESPSSRAKRAIKMNQKHLAHDHYYHRLRDEKIVKKEKSINQLQNVISELKDNLKRERKKVQRLQRKVTELEELISMYQQRWAVTRYM